MVTGNLSAHQGAPHKAHWRSHAQRGGAVMSPTPLQRRGIAAAAVHATGVLLWIGMLSVVLARGVAGTTRSLEAASAAVMTATEREPAEFSYPIPTGHRWAAAHRKPSRLCSEISRVLHPASHLLADQQQWMQTDAFASKLRPTHLRGWPRPAAKLSTSCQLRATCS